MFGIVWTFSTHSAPDRAEMISTRLPWYRRVFNVSRENNMNVLFVVDDEDSVFPSVELAEIEH